MDIIFQEKNLRELYHTGKTSDKKHRFQSAIIRKYIRVIDLMIDQPGTLALKKYNSLNYKKLKGNKEGLSCTKKI